MPEYYDPWPDEVPPQPPPPPAPPEQPTPWVEPVPPSNDDIVLYDEPAPVGQYAESAPGEPFPPIYDPLLPVVELVPKIGWAIPAWILILIVVGLELFVAQVDQREDPNEPPAKSVDLEFHIFKSQGRYLVGANEINKGQGKELLHGVDKHNHSYESQLHYAILEGELDKPSAAQETLEGLAGPWDDTPESIRLRKLRTILLRLYEDYADDKWQAQNVSADDRTYLEKELGWYGKLALAPAKGPDFKLRSEVLAGARAMVTGLIVGFLLALALGMFGFIGLLIFLILACSGRLRSGVQTGVMHSGVYAETFALWMLALFGLSLAGHFNLLNQLVPREDRLITLGIVELFSLVILAWPVIRGVPWRQVREDIGLTFGRQPLVEPFLGIGTYILSLPLIGIGMICTLILQAILGHGGNKALPLGDHEHVHPIVYQLVQANNWELFQIFFLACVVAPVVEEIMFRGVLYRQVREATSMLGRVGSIILGALVVSFIFAVIHPQGFVAVPLLMSLAIGFTLAREWRGTVIPGIVAHGINNGLVMSLAIWLLRN